MSKKYTPWFPVETAPVRRGVYQVLASRGDVWYYSHFDGKRFHGGWSTPQEASRIRWKPGCFFSSFIVWRGLAKKP